MERVVSRSALQSPASTPEPASGQALTARVADFDFVNSHEAPAVDDEIEEQLDFRLFATTQATQDGETRKIRLKSPTPTSAEPGLVGSGRDLSYYITGSLSRQQVLDLESAAVTGQQVLARSGSAWPGSAYSWKVVRVPVTCLSKSVIVHSLPETQEAMDGVTPGKRKRPGKKSRIKLRIKLASESRQQEADRAAVACKEAAEREKKSRRNREKKAKKKLREKARKAGVAGEAPEADGSDGESGNSAPG